MSDSEALDSHDVGVFPSSLASVLWREHLVLCGFGAPRHGDFTETSGIEQKEHTHTHTHMGTFDTVDSQILQPVQVVDIPGITV